jgi:membrane protein YdbS with pleckstrin-like domain
MLEWMGVGVSERDVTQRVLATVVLFALALACTLGFVWMWMSWPFWIAFPSGLLLISAGVAIAIFLVGRIVRKKVKAPYDRFGE